MNIMLLSATQDNPRPAWSDLECCGSGEYIAFLERLKRTAEGEIMRRDPVSSLDLSTRAANVLRYGKITSISQLLELSPAQVANLYMCGRKARHEIRMALSSIGIELPNWSESHFPKWP